jgi:glycosyltransferase involved in cell wall biosynthesis
VRLLLVHNHYQQPGGEDRVYYAEAELLRERGHTVAQYSEHNDRIRRGNSARVALETIWSERSKRQLARVLADFRPDVAHFHNTFPLISPAAYYACHAAGVPVVQTMHNYRLGCPQASFFRDNRICEDCRAKTFAWPGIVHACYRGSRATTAVIALMNAAHRLQGTWLKRVDAYIALSEFARRKLIDIGLPANKVAVKGNFVHPDPGVGNHDGRYMLFVGRLVAEKGILTLLNAWARLASPIPLKIVGTGPLAAQVAQAASKLPGVEWLGPRSTTQVLDLMGDASALLFPSEWHEPFGLVAVESFAKATPVIGAQSGALPELIEHRTNGLLYRQGATQLAETVEWAASHPVELAHMGRQARLTFQAKHTADRSYDALVDIYERCMAARRG